ncbi:MAG: hypothetical protein Q7K29_08375 [Thermoleophilia bacterium]|nr:hypothetical protein [Thermoleophilia bacterium]
MKIHKITSNALKRAGAGVIFFALFVSFALPTYSVQASYEPQPDPILTTGAAISQPVQNSQPDLVITSTRAFWYSYVDYQSRRLDVTSTIVNSGAIEAVNVQLTGSVTDSGVELFSMLPMAIGNINAGGSASVTVKYRVPFGVSSFRRSTTASAVDIFGNHYTYPASAQQPGEKAGMSVGDNLSSLSNQELESSLADMESLGITWLRFDLAWDLVQPNDAAHFDWSRYDRIVIAAGNHNMKLMPILVFTPRWARQQSCINNFQCAPADPAKFAAFAKEAATHYAPMGIKSWEIWNEPNIDAFWLPSPNAAAYTQLLRASYAGIKQADPQATVISGGLSPAENTGTRIAPRDFLTAMYQNGGGGYFDAVGYHPYSYPALPGNIQSWSGWSQMNDLNPSIRSIMIANGDSSKSVWVTEVGTPSGGRSDVSESLQAQSYRDAVQQMSNKPWMAAMFFHTYKDLSSDPGTVESFFGLIRHDGTRKPAYYELKDVLQTQ